MKKLSVTVALAFIGLTSGCAKDVKISAPFDEGAAKAMIQKGNNQVSGSGLIRKMNGEVVTCAGEQVSMLPVTAASREWAGYTYAYDNRASWDDSSGYHSTSGDKAINISTSEPFLRHMLTTHCDVSGRFSFKDVADGDFYVFTRINWSVYDPYAGQVTQGGSVMRKVHLKGGETKEVVLSP